MQLFRFEISKNLKVKIFESSKVSKLKLCDILEYVLKTAQHRIYFKLLLLFMDRKMLYTVSKKLQ